MHIWILIYDVSNTYFIAKRNINKDKYILSMIEIRRRDLICILNYKKNIKKVNSPKDIAILKKI